MGDKVIHVHLTLPLNSYSINGKYSYKEITRDYFLLFS